MNEPIFLLNYQSLAEFTELYEKNPDGPLRSKTAVALFAVKEGSGHCYIDDTLIVLKPGILIVMNPGSRMHPVNTQLVLGNVITFEPQFLSDIDVKAEYCREIIGEHVKYVVLDLVDDTVMLTFMRTQIHMFSWQYRLYVNSLIKQQLLGNILSGILLNIFRNLSLPYVTRVFKNIPEST